MAEWINWVFDGIGTEILVAVISLIIGGIGGFTIGKHTKSSQTQEAGDSAKQKQAITIDNGILTDSKKSQETNVIIQKQRAGNDSEQIQTGSIKHERR